MGWEPHFRILSVNPQFPAANEPFTVDRLTALADRGHDVRVLSARGLFRIGDGASGSLSTTRRPGVLRLIARLTTALARNPWFVGRLVARLRRMHSGPEFWQELARLLPAACCAPDVVHFEWLNDATRHLELIDVFPGVKVASSQGSDLRVAPDVSAWIRHRLPATLRALDGVHCVSDDLASIALSYGADAEKTVVIPNGIDTSYFSTDAYPRRRSESDHLRLVSVGRLNWVKGFTYALHAIRMLLDRGHDVRYTILGGDDGEGWPLRIAIRDLGLQTHVLLGGHASRFRVRAVLANSDAFLLPSVSEGQSVALLEAMAMTLPIIATNVGGNGEVVCDGEHGLLVPARDPAGIADAAERLLRDPTWARQMGALGAARVRERFDARTTIDELVAFYERLVPSWRIVHRPAAHNG